LPRRQGRREGGDVGIGRPQSGGRRGGPELPPGGWDEGTTGLRRMVGLADPKSEIATGGVFSRHTIPIPTTLALDETTGA